MPQLYANNALSTLLDNISNVSLSLQVATGEGAKFPAITGGDFFLVTLSKVTGGVESDIEVVRVTARTGDVLTIVRAQEGTTALSYLAADLVQLRMTAATHTALEAHLNSTSNPHATTKAQIGLANVDNTTDALKPVSTAQAAADAAVLAAAAPIAHVGAGGAAHANVVAAGAAGFMTGADKTKLDGVASGATANTGTVTTTSVATANGFAGSVANAGTTPAITLTTSVTGLVKGNGTALSAAVVRTDYAEPTTALATGLLKNTTSTGAHTIAAAGTDFQAPIGTISGLAKGNGANTLTAAVVRTDYAEPTTALATGILKNTTGSGAHTIAVAGDFPTLNQSTTGNAATVTTNANLTGHITSVGNTTALGSFTLSQLNIALSDANVASGGGTATGSNTGDNAVNSLYSGLVSNATHTGDVTGSTALTLATVIAAAGPIGSASVVPVITYDLKGRLTAVSSAAITPAAIGAQATLVSGTNVKTVNGLSLVGSGDVAISSGGAANSIFLANNFGGF